MMILSMMVIALQSPLLHQDFQDRRRASRCSAYTLNMFRGRTVAKLTMFFVPTVPHASSRTELHALEASM